MRLAGVRDLLAAVAFGEHHHAAAVLLEQLDVRVHAAGGGRPERSGRIARRRLRGARVVDAVVLHVRRQPGARVDPLLELGVRDVARDDQRAAQRQPGLDRVARQRREDLAHRHPQIDPNHLAGELRGRGVREEPRRIGLELLEEHAVLGDLAERLAIRRARHRDRHRAARAVARQPDHAGVVAEVLPAELRADAGGARDVEDLGLPLEIAERAAEVVAGGRQAVEVARRRELGDLERLLGAGAADHHGEVVRRARRRPERAQLLSEERGEARRVEQRLGLLEQQALVRRAAALGHEQEVVLVAAGGVELDLRRQVVAGVLLLEHVERRDLRVAQVGRGVGVEHAAREGALVDAVAGHDHVLALLAHDDRRAGVLAPGEDPARGDVRVPQQLERDELVVRGRLGVVEDRAELAEVPGAQQVGDVAHRGATEQGQRLGRDLEEAAAAGLERGHQVTRQLLVRGVVVVPGLEDLLEREGRHRGGV